MTEAAAAAAAAATTTTSSLRSVSQFLPGANSLFLFFLSAAVAVDGAKNDEASAAAELSLTLPDTDGDVEREVLAGGRASDPASERAEKEGEREHRQESATGTDADGRGRAGERAISAHGLQAVALAMVSLELESSFRISAAAAAASSVNGATTTTTGSAGRLPSSTTAAEGSSSSSSWDATVAGSDGRVRGRVSQDSNTLKIPAAL